jgi:predicted membrane channel-forming protein YqfA (hemolysin III family)
MKKVSNIIKIIMIAVFLISLLNCFSVNTSYASMSWSDIRSKGTRFIEARRRRKYN